MQLVVMIMIMNIILIMMVMLTTPLILFHLIHAFIIQYHHHHSRVSRTKNMLTKPLSVFISLGKYIHIIIKNVASIKNAKCDIMYYKLRRQRRLQTYQHFTSPPTPYHLFFKLISSYISQFSPPTFEP